MTNPLTMVIPPRVAMNAGTLPLWMIIPINAPIIAPAIRAMPIAAHIGKPATINLDANILLKARTEPTERSMPPERITNVIPMARTPMIAVCLKRFVTFTKDRNISFAIHKANINTAIIMIRLLSAIRVNLL